MIAGCVLKSSQWRFNVIRKKMQLLIIFKLYIQRKIEKKVFISHVYILNICIMLLQTIQKMAMMHSFFAYLNCHYRLDILLYCNQF